jgi:hypothetical protein
MVEGKQPVAAFAAETLREALEASWKRAGLAAWVESLSVPIRHRPEEDGGRPIGGHDAGVPGKGPNRGAHGRS